MSFDPPIPIEGEKLTIEVTSAKAHQNVRLDGPGSTGLPDKVEKGGKGWIWSWRITVPKSGRLSYTFYVQTNTPCTANQVVAEPVTPPVGVEFTCSEPNVTSAPGTVKIKVNMRNLGPAQDTFNVNISPNVPGGWQVVLCIGSTCYTEGPVPVTLGSGDIQQIEVQITIPDSATSGQKGSATLSAISQSNASVNASIKVSATRQ